MNLTGIRSTAVGSMRRRTLRHFILSLLVLSLITLTGSGKHRAQSDAGTKFKPTDVQLLSIDSPTKDEDPSVIRARDGTLFVAWFSDRGGNSDIYITSSNNGADWTPAVRVTASPDGDFAPSLFQDDHGLFHLVWFRWSALYRGHIWHNSSPDGLTWDQKTETQVTTGLDVDDWVPTITQAPDGSLLVFFVSEKRNAVNPTNDIYVARKAPADGLWGPAVAVEGINSATEHDHLPFAARTGDRITLVWVRHDTAQFLPWLSARSDLFYSTSTDGVSWKEPSRITSTNGNVVNLFPALFTNLDEQWYLEWLSTKSGQPKVFELPLVDAGQYPLGLVKNKKLRAGYSHRSAPTSTPGVFIGVWVEGPEGAQDIYYRFFKKK